MHFMHVMQVYSCLCTSTRSHAPRGTALLTLCVLHIVPSRTQSVLKEVPTQSVGTSWSAGRDSDKGTCLCPGFCARTFYESLTCADSSRRIFFSRNEQP